MGGMGRLRLKRRSPASNERNACSRCQYPDVCAGSLNKKGLVNRRGHFVTHR